MTALKGFLEERGYIGISLPATTANLGPGFDSLGLALSLYNSFSFEETKRGLEILGTDKKYFDENNLVYRALKRGFDYLSYPSRGIKIIFDSSIPISRGLGSSASCVLAGLLAASELAGGGLSTSEILRLAVEIEGHPDNLVAALLGGFTVSLLDRVEVYYVRHKVPQGLKFIAIIPDYTLSTKDSRSVLPIQVAFKDASGNISRVSLLVSALVSGNFELLDQASRDFLHEPYRKPMILGFDGITKRARELGALASFISGAGPTIIAIVDEDNYSFKSKMASFLKSLSSSFQLEELFIDDRGAELYRK